MAAKLRVIQQGINVLADATSEMQLVSQGIQVLWKENPSAQAQGTLSDYLENAILDQLFQKTPLAEVTIWIGVSTEDPSESGANLAEPTGDTYQRVETSSSYWTAAAAGALSNALDITFPVVRASWCTISHFALFDASAGGNMLAWGELDYARDLSASHYLGFHAGFITATMR